MLKAENRLKGQANFSQARKAGERLRTHYILFFTELETKQPLKIGLVVSKKVDKRAVVRNRFRRTIAHLFEHICHETAAKNMTVVAVLLRAPTHEPFRQLETDVQQWRAKYSPA